MGPWILASVARRRACPFRDADTVAASALLGQDASLPSENSQVDVASLLRLWKRWVRGRSLEVGNTYIISGFFRCRGYFIRLGIEYFRCFVMEPLENRLTRG